MLYKKLFPFLCLLFTFLQLNAQVKTNVISNIGFFQNNSPVKITNKNGKYRVYLKPEEFTLKINDPSTIGFMCFKDTSLFNPVLERTKPLATFSGTAGGGGTFNLLLQTKQVELYTADFNFFMDGYTTNETSAKEYVSFLKEKFGETPLLLTCTQQFFQNKISLIKTLNYTKLKSGTYLLVVLKLSDLDFKDEKGLNTFYKVDYTPIELILGK